MQPLRQRPRFQPDPRHPSLQPAEEPDKGLRLARHFCLAHDLAEAIHHAHAAVFQRHVDPGEILHHCAPCCLEPTNSDSASHHHSGGQSPRRGFWRRPITASSNSSDFGLRAPLKVRGTGRVFGWRDRVENIGKVDVLGRVAWGDHRPKPWVYPNRAVWVGKLSPTELVIPEGVMRQMRDGLAYARGNRPVFLMLLSFAAIACTARGIMELAPSIAATVLDGDLKTLSWMMSSFAVGALSAGIFIARWSTWPERLTIITTLTGSALSL